ncbi:unnamed protein product [Sphagnum jensenii]|uniref:Elongation factor P n=1 Tax=Sphagnum jensenii TaxID=128206 RepID=A0ABP1B091_9BRYO
MWTIGMAVTMVSPFPTTAACTSSVSTSFRNGEFALARLQSTTRTLRCCRAHPSSLELRAISSNDFRGGTNIVLDGAPWRVQEFLHVKPGKGAAFVRTKLRNYISGNTVERTFRAGEQVDEAQIVKDVKQHTYVDGDQYVFMDMVTFEETRLDLKDLGDRSKWLKEGMECNVLTWNGRVIDVDLPITVIVKVVETDPGLKGDTAQGGSKPATVETGAVVSVPLFVNIGDSIQVDTRTGSYMNRA